MSAKLAALQALAAQDVAESGIDMNEAVKGGGGARLLPEGYAMARIVEYIEYGNQPQEYMGVAKEAALEFTMGFALYGQGYQNDDGTPYVLRTYSTALSRNEKARAFKLFKALNWKGTAKGFAQLLGDGILVKIKHQAKSKTDATVVSRIDFEGFLPPFDALSKQPYPIPEASDDLYRMFLWNTPTKEAWDSLFIEGMWEAKDGKPAESKNRIQEAILGALDYQGSPLQQLLGGAVMALPGAVAAPAAAPAMALPQVAPAPVAVPVAAVSPPFEPSPNGVPQQVAAIPAVASVPAVAPAPTSVPAVVATPAPVMVAVPVAVPAVTSPVLPA